MMIIVLILYSITNDNCFRFRAKAAAANYTVCLCPGDDCSSSAMYSAIGSVEVMPATYQWTRIANTSATELRLQIDRPEFSNPIDSSTLRT